MKNIRILKKITLFVIMMAMMASFSSCAKKVAFLTSSVVPAAEGFVQVKKDKNENYGISLKISNLAEVDKLQPPKKTYVVWMETDRGLTKNIGQLASSRNLNATFETVSSFKPIKIYLTAEDNENIQYPGTVVLSTDVFWR